MRKSDPRMNDDYKEIRIKFPKKLHRRIQASIVRDEFTSFNDAVITILSKHFNLVQFSNGSEQQFKMVQD